MFYWRNYVSHHKSLYVQKQVSENVAAFIFIIIVLCHASNIVMTANAISYSSAIQSHATGEHEEGPWVEFFDNI